jgi:hypothetical protein
MIARVRLCVPVACWLLGGGCQATSRTNGAGVDLGSGGMPTDGSIIASVDAGKPDARLFPLAVGYSWTFDVQSTGTEPNPCGSGMHDQKVQAEQTMGGRDAFAVTSYCAATTGAQYYSLLTSQLDLYWDSDSSWHLDLDLTLQDGRSWSDGSGTNVWSSEGTIVVPAGTFTGCWRATKQVAYDAYTIYCPGAGVVQTHLKDTSNGAGWDDVLVAKTF